MKAPARNQPSPSQRPTTSSASRLVRLFRLESSTEGEWGPGELRAVFRHQWGIPFAPSLVVDKGSPGVVRDGAREIETGRERGSLEQLLTRHDPPLEALISVKDWAKAQLAAKDPHLPRDVAFAIYYAAVFAARVRLGRSISSLSLATLTEAARWLLNYN